MTFRGWAGTQRLGFRLAILMAVALLPLGIVAYAQTRNLANEAQARTEAALLGATLRAASSEVGIIRQARGLVEGLAVNGSLLVTDPAQCQSLLSLAQQRADHVAIVTFIPMSGRMICSSTGRSFDYSDDPLFLKARDLRTPSFLVNTSGPLTGQSVLGVLEPVFDVTGTKLGFISAWLPHSQLNERSAKSMLAPSGKEDAAISFWTFSRDGEVLTSSVGLDGVKAILPVDRTLTDLADDRDGVFRDRTADGEARTYAVVPLADGDLYLMSSWNARDASAFERFGVDPKVFPILMWLAGLFASIWAAELLVGRHVRLLHRSISAFASGDRRRQEIDLAGAPLELRQMAESYLIMTDSITKDEAQLEDTIHQKDVLLREVHHRVKNNLQLIASIMSMQLRRARSPETRGLLRNLQDRVMSLATIHRGLYQTSGLADVRADELLSDIVKQIVNLGSGASGRFAIEEDFDDIRLIPDQAVPLSLLLTEAMTNAMRFGTGTGTDPIRIVVRLKRSGPGDVRLEVRNSASNPAPPDSVEAGLGAQLIAAFTMQVGGTLTQGMDGDDYTLSVIFPVAALSDAEQRDHPAGKLTKSTARD